ncbi:MAG: translation initiation factor IF-2 [Verrucomicrobia bacterium 21-51-4]|nr:MAG: translation initiation factor IF-2 [Verrucomicrobia bacterium 21-51-4]
MLDSIRKANVVAGEAGGITQHIGAYQVEHKNHKITFLDTPGHAAFSKMRERGANITDIAVLVVAADDGFMPQTDEALKFAQKAGVPLVVAINKMDAKGANIERVKQQLQQRGIASEDWGGETLCSAVSALKGQGINELLDSILLQAEIMELKAPVEGTVEGTVVESQVEPGMGATATIIVQKGTLKVGDSLVCGGEYARVRAMSDEHGKAVKVATPSTPVRIMGWSGAPDAGAICTSVKSDKEARAQAEENAIDKKREARLVDTSSKGPTNVEELFAALSDTKKTFKLLVKTDVHGSLEALIHCLADIKSDKIALEVIDGTVGLVTKNDVALASASGATIAAFNTRLDQGVAGLAKHHSVRILQHNIIYEILDQVREAMADLLDPELREVKKGAAEVRQVFSLGKGIVAGCMVTEGKIERDGLARLLRKGQVVFEGKVSALKRFKDDASEVRAGYECGLRLGDYEAYEAKDIVECYEIEKIKPKL